MSARELVLLSPYRYPAQHPLTLADEDMAAWLNAHVALWHPAALWRAGGTPRVESPYDHENPRPGCLYAVPETPPSFLPDDWQARVRAAGSTAFIASPDREVTLARLREALTAAAPVAAEGQAEAPPGAELPGPGRDDPDATAKLLALPAEVVSALAGIGTGHLLLAALCEAMEHENLLETDDFQIDLQQAIAAAANLPLPTGRLGPGDAPESPPVEEPPASHDLFEQGYAEPAEEVPQAAPEPEVDQQPAWLRHLGSAALRLLSARETLYPVTIHLLDLALIDDAEPAKPWIGALAAGLPGNVVASGQALQKLAEANPDQMRQLAEWVQGEKAEVCGGSLIERADVLLPIESQLWNLREGLRVSRELLGAEIKVYARRRFGTHPQLPVWLNQHGLSKALLLSVDDSSTPQYSGTSASWATQDGKQIDAFVRKPLDTSSIDAFFNLGHQLFKTTREDHTATLAFLHGAKPAQSWYGDFLALAQFGPIAGTWTTFGRYFQETSAGDYVGSLTPDELHFDHLSERVPYDPAAAETVGLTTPPSPFARATAQPVSAFAQFARLRRRIDTCWSLAALQRGVAGANDPQNVASELERLETQLELNAPDDPPADCLAALQTLEHQISSNLAARLQARSAEGQPGYLLLNPCAFTRRLALELPAKGAAPPLGEVVKAAQVDGHVLRVVADLPALGFAWFPAAGPAGAAPPPGKMRLADERCVRNEFFEAEIDAATGGLRAIRDHKTMINRLAQRLTFRPGSTMKATKVTTTSTGPALGEIVTEGQILGLQGQVLARFIQRFRAWLARPILDIRIELIPEQPPAGYPWHAYFGCQFAWRDERGALLRGFSGMSYLSSHLRPQSPDFLELRLGRQSTTIFPGGLPFHNRDGGRMLDVILVPPGETARTFDLAVGLDREMPIQTALGVVTPATVVPTAKGPPHVGVKGWLFHLDAANMMLTSLRPGTLERSGETGAAIAGVDAVTARLLECGGFHTPAEMRCVRDPRRVAMLDARGQFLIEGTYSGDAALFHLGPGDLGHLQIEFGQK